MVSEAPQMPSGKSCSSCTLYSKCEGHLIVRQAVDATLEAERSRLDDSLVPQHVDQLLAAITRLLEDRVAQNQDDPDLQVAAGFVRANLAGISEAQKEAFRLELAHLGSREASQKELNLMVDELLRSVAQHGCKGVNATLTRGYTCRAPVSAGLKRRLTKQLR